MAAQVDQNDLPDEAFLRLDSIVSTPEKPGRYPIGSTTWWRWVRTNKAPQPIRLSPGITAWRVGDLRAWERQQAAQGAAQ